MSGSDRAGQPATPVEYDPFAGSEILRSVPSTESQRELWLGSQVGAQSSLAYNESVEIRFSGAFDASAMRSALGGLVARHEALRATFSADGLTMNVDAGSTLEVPLVDLKAAEPQARAARLAAVRAAQVERPFDLERGPLFRAEIVRLDEREHVVFLTSHHIVCDGWSAGVLVADLAALYAGARGEPRALAPAERFSDYAVAERAREGSPESAADERYWIERFAGAVPPPLDLPTDRPRPPLRTTASARLDHDLDGELVKGIKRLGAKQGGSLFVTLLSGFAAVLHRLTGQTDVVVGIPAAGQAAGGHQSLVGNCVNTLPIRAAIDPATPFSAVVKTVRTAMLDASDHQGITFGTLLRKLPLARDPSRLPLVNFVFNCETALSTQSALFPGLDFQFGAVPRRHENFELFINAVEHAGGVRVECQYARDLFDGETVARWLTALEILFRSELGAAPGTALGRLEVRGDEERALLAAFNRTEAETRPARLVQDLVREQARATPERAAVAVGSGATLSYGALEARSNAVARRLRALGVVPGHLVGLATERGPQMLVGLLGILKAGAGYVPLDPAFPDDRLDFMIADARIEYCLTESGLAMRFGRQAKPVLLDDPGLVAVEDAGELDGPKATPDDVAYVIYTSGSTGKPKGVRLPHRAVVNFLASMRGRPGLTAKDRLLAVTTLSFDIAVLELLLPLTVGAEIVLASRDEAIDGHALRALAETRGATVMQATPATWRMLIEAGWSGAPGFKALCGGEPLAADLADALLERAGEVWNMYGPTETTVWSTCWRVERERTGIWIGTPIANTQVWILDDQLRSCPIGVPGELYIGGEGVALGYLDRPELTAERFVADPFAGGGARMYRTGDLGRWRADGQLECLGRTDFQVKVRGHRIELGEIEAALVTHPGVRQAVAMAREDRPGDVRLVAYVVPRGEAVGAQALHEHLASTLPEYMIPGHFVTLGELPLLPNGKINRRALPAPAAVDLPAEGELVPPSGPTQLQVAETFQELLAVPRIGVNDNFFLLGGHSLLAAQAAARLGRAFGRTIPMRVLFEAPTVARLATWLDGETKAEARPAPAVIPRRADGSWAPLSLMQQRVWFVEELNPGRGVHNVPSTHRLRGKLDEAAFVRAFAELLARQSSLRTVIGMREDPPVQRVLPEVAVSLFPAEDLSSLPEAEREATLRAKVTADVARPILLGEGLLFRAKMYKLGPEEHAFFFMVHHIVWDGWSFDLLYDEMAALYSAFSEGKPSPLAPLPVSYGDFAAWQREFMQGTELARQVAHWTKQLDGALEPLALPTDFPRAREASERGGIEWLRVPLEEAERVRALGQRVEATSFMVLLALYYVLLARLSGQRDLVVGTPVRGRSLLDVENVMGFFVNALPLRLAVDPDAPFIEVLKQVRALVLDAFAAEDVPFEHLVRALNVPRDTSRSPIFQTFFSYQDVRGRSLDWGNLRHDRIPVSQPGLSQDLSLWFVERPNGLLGGLNYALDLFTAETARTINERYLTLLRGALADPQAAVRDLPLVAAAEREQVAAWNDTAAEYPRDRRVEALVEEQARRTPDRPAIVCGEATISHGALEARANRLARCLRRRGVGRGTLVGVALERSIDMVASVLAVLKAGATYVPLDPAYPPARLALMVEDSQMKVIVASRGVAASLGFAALATLAPEEDASEIEGESGEASAPPPEAASVEDAAYVIYTSGSTGKPKGVRLPHRAVVNFLSSMRGRPGLTAGDRLLAVTTLSFDIAVLELLLPLTVGAEIVLASRDEAVDGHALRGLAEGRGATVMQATPATWRMLIEAGWSGTPGFKALCGGEPLPSDLADALLERTGEIWNMYGPTETTVWSTCWRVERDRSGIWIGTPVANTQVWILDQQLRPCPIGVPGEIYIGGDGVALGYLDRPELTAERFVADPFAGGGARMYRTGDLGRWRPDGQLECLGRTDFQVKVRGHRIELGEIEAALATHPTVAQAVVAARAGVGAEKQLCAYLVARPDQVPTSSDLRRHLRLSLPEYMVPPTYVVLDAFPLTPNGKVDRRALPDPDTAALASGDRADEFAPPETEMEQTLASVWREILKVSQIGLQDNFFDLGGHSLLVMRVIVEMEKRTGRRIGPRAFIFSTLGQVAAAYDEVGSAAPPPSKSAPPSAGGPKRGGLLSRLLKS